MSLPAVNASLWRIKNWAAHAWPFHPTASDWHWAITVSPSTGVKAASPSGMRSGENCCMIRTPLHVINRVLFTRDGRHVLSAALNGVSIYDANTGQLVAPLFQEDHRVWRMALSADGRLLATCDTKSARLWELATRQRYPARRPDPLRVGCRSQSRRAHPGGQHQKGARLSYSTGPPGKRLGNCRSKLTAIVKSFSHRRAAG